MDLRTEKALNPSPPAASMSDPTSHELLRELLNEVREIRRQLARQSDFLETAAFFLKDGAADHSRARHKEMLGKRRRKVGKLYRRVFSSQQPLADWLARKGLEIIHFTDDGMESGPADEIAERLATDFVTLGPFLKHLNIASAVKEGFSFSLADHDETEADAIETFAQRLEDLGLVRAMNLAGGQIHVEPLLDQGLDKFLTGGWLERALGNLVARLRPERWAPHLVLANAVTRDSTDMAIHEFDLVLPLDGGPGGDQRDGSPLVLDPKTGNLEPSVAKVRRNVSRLGLSPEHYVVVRPCADPADLAAWRDALPETTVMGFPVLAEFLATY